MNTNQEGKPVSTAESKPPTWIERISAGLVPRSARPKLPNQDHYSDDMQAIARLGRQLWIEAVWWRRNGDTSAPKPEVGCDELETYYSTPNASASAMLSLAIDDFADIDVAAIGRVA